MADDTEFIKLPLLQRCTHKLWKARVHGYTEAAKVFQEEEDEKAAIFGQFLGLVSKFVCDSHAAAQEKGLEATLYFVQNSSVAGKTVRDVMSSMIAKSIASPKKTNQDLSLQIALMYIEVEKQEAVVEELVKGLEHKNPKIVAACLTILTTSLREFGSQVVGIKPLVKPMQGLLEDRDKTVRDETKALVIEIYRWIGDAIKPQLSKLKPIQLTELEVEFGKVKGGKAVPTRYLRSQQAKQAKATAQAAEECADTGVVAAEIEVDPLSLIDPINVLEKIPSGFYDKLEAKKWQERKEAIETLDKILDYPKFEKGDYGDLVRALMKIITKDSNVVVVGATIKCIARLALGLKKGFHQYANATLPQLLAKFKEKKATVVTPLREAVDAIYPVTTLEAIQEDIVSFLDNKNPAIKAETASFLGRCFALCTPTILNKKLLKTLATALLKTLNEPDPVVRDCSAEALGIAMKVVGEKVLLPFLPDIDPLKLSKIKECCEKAVVKTVKAAPKVEPTPAKAEAPKKVLSGGAIKAQAPKVQKPVVVEKVMSSEEIDEKAAQLVPEDVLKNLADATWKTRLDSIETFQNSLMSMDPSEEGAEVMTGVLVKKPGLKDNNFQVLKLKLDCLKFLAETFPMSKAVAESVVADVTDKLGDPKNGTLAGETLMALAEVSNLDIIGSAVLEFAFTQKSVKVQQEALDWIGEAIQNFGLIIQSKTVVDHLKKGLNSTNSGVRQSAAALAGIVHLYLGQQLLQRLDEKPAVVALVNVEIEKHAGEDALEPSRVCKIPYSPEPVYQAPAKSPKSEPVQRKVEEYADDDEDEVKEEKKPAQRVDISPKITEQLLAEIGDKNWKVRNEALLTIQGMVTNTKIKSNLGELPPVLVQRFVDSNSKLVTTALELCTTLATAMGPGSKNHVRSFARGIFNALGDNKQWVRTAAMTCLNAWTTEAGAKEFFSGEIIPDVLKTGSATLRIEIWTWLGELLPNEKGLPKDELCLLIPLLFAAIEDRSAEVRKAGNGAVLGIMTHVGYHNMAKEVDKMKPASKAGILQILDKIRPDVPEIETKTKAKPEVKGKNPVLKSASAGKVRTSIVPAPAKPTSRKVTEDVDTSPLLLINKMKNQRVLDEQKLKILKWNFTTPRAEFIELLRDQMNSAGFNKTLVANMFHADFKFHIKAIESLSDDLGNDEALIANLDLILKWMTLRFFDTNPSVLLKGLEYLQTAFQILIDREYTVFDVEANSFIPYLVMKIGDPKDAVRDRVHAILRQFSVMHVPGKLFLLIMDGLKSKNSRLRTECLDELGYLIEQFGTSVCLPSSAVALKEISKQISDRDNSVRSAALNAIVKAYFVDGEKIYKQIGKLNDKDMSYLEERIKRASQNRTKMMNETTRMPQSEVKRKIPEPEVVEEYEAPEEPEMESEPQPVHAYVPEPLPYAFQNPYKNVEIPSTQYKKLDLIEIDDSFLKSPVLIPESIRLKMQNDLPPNPLVVDIIRNVASENITTAIEGAKKLHSVLQSEKLESYGKQILDAIITQLRLANSYTFAEHGATLGQLYKILLKLVEDIFAKKTPIGLNADENHLKYLIRELLIALVDEKTVYFQDGGLNQFIVLIVVKITENSDTTNVICASVNALSDLVGNPPSNPKLTDITVKSLLKIIILIRRANDIDSLLNLDKVLYSCHLFMQKYPRDTWKDMVSDVPLKALKTLLANLVTKKGQDILTHMRGIENPTSSELAGYLKKLIVQTPNASKTSGKLSKAMSDNLSEIFKQIAHDSNGNDGMVQLYEFKKQHPDVDLTAILAPTTSFFQEYVAEGLKQIEKERGPLQKAPETTPLPKVAVAAAPIPVPNPPSDYTQLPEYYKNVLKQYQQRLGLQIDLPDFEPFDTGLNQ